MKYYRPVRTEETKAGPHAAAVATPRRTDTGPCAPKEGARKCTKRFADLLGINIVLLAVFIVGCSGDAVPTPTAISGERMSTPRVVLGEPAVAPSPVLTPTA